MAARLESLARGELIDTAPCTLEPPSPTNDRSFAAQIGSIRPRGAARQQAGTLPGVDDNKLAALTADPTAYLSDPDPIARRLAVSASFGRAANPAVSAQLVELLAHDPEPRVRAEAAEVLGAAGPAALEPLMAATSDPDPIVVEAVATGLGELEDPAAVPWLIEAARTNGDRLVREAAVAALGATGDPRALPVLLDLVASGPPQVRRRCVVALTVFDGDEVEAAIRAAAVDRNPMVREAAEMVVGRPTPGWTALGVGEGLPAEEETASTTPTESTQA